MIPSLTFTGKKVYIEMNVLLIEWSISQRWVRVRELSPNYQVIRALQIVIVWCSVVLRRMEFREGIKHEAYSGTMGVLYLKDNNVQAGKVLLSTKKQATHVWLITISSLEYKNCPVLCTLLLNWRPKNNNEHSFKLKIMFLSLLRVSELSV